MNPTVKKLIKLSDFLETLKIGGIVAKFTTNAADATEQLNSASGFQIVTSRPELTHRTNGDSFSAVIFILDKSLGNGRTATKENTQYRDLLHLAGEVISAVVNSTEDGSCSRSLLGMELVSYNLVPEISLFGGWLGWSIEMDFE